MCRYYHIGPNSIVQNLPQPNISLIEDHSYVLVWQYIADYLGKGYTTPQNFNEYKTIQHNPHDSLMAQKVYQRAMK